jgi:rhodanese-related sulfurtransferase/glyoxylase-like metal-dependent hydrolase (beta-lactamase superfamily II)
MYFKQYYLGCLAHASYLLADERTGTAVVVDPQRDVEQYLHDAARGGFAIRYVFLTHFHADFLAGHLELRDSAGAAICLGARAAAEYSFKPMREGDRLEFGVLGLEILETPGHSPESICLLVYDLARSREHPWAVLTGDTLFIGDVGRPDLRASLGWSAETLAGLLYDSIQKLLALPDETLVYPAHGAGSLCGKSLASQTVSTIGFQRRYNYALQPMRREAFVRLVTADQPEAPPYFTYDAVRNTRERPTLESALEKALRPLRLDDVLRMAEQGAQLLDVRPAADFAAAHLQGSIHIGLAGQYATWAGTILSQDLPIVILAEPGRETEAATRLGRIGFDNIAGYLEGGIQACRLREDLIRRHDRLAPATLAELLETPRSPLLLDVRTHAEWAAKHIPGAVHVPLRHLAERLEEIPRDRVVVAYCQGGYRSAIAVSLLDRSGFPRLADLAGGIAAWEAGGLPLRSGGSDAAARPNDPSA